MASENEVQEPPVSLETATVWARSNNEWDKVYRYLFLHPKDFFVITETRRWPIAHQVVYHGKVDLFKRILAIFYDDQININTKSKDNKTLLDVATERRNAYPLMFTYVSHLFTQDELMTNAKNHNWQSVKDLLIKNKELANEKPPYSPYFLLHYVVENGNAQILQDLLENFQFLTNVLNNKNENPLDMAIRLNKHDMCSILRPKTVPRSNSVQSMPQTPSPQSLPQPNEQITDQSKKKSLNNSTDHQQPSSTPSPSQKPIDPKTKLPCIGFSGLVVGMTQNGDYTVEQPTLINSTHNPVRLPQPSVIPKKQLPPSSPQQQQQGGTSTSSGFKHVYTRKTIIKEVSLTDLDPPEPSPITPSTTCLSTNEHVMKNLTCTLTQKIFVDPVIATDGQTYERAAIIEWINKRHCSPITGSPMDATLRDNKEIKALIQSIQNQN